MEIELGENDEIPNDIGYFGEMEIPIEDTGEWEETDEAMVYNEGESGVETVHRDEIDDWDNHFFIAEWTGEKRSIEYFECSDCLPEE